MQLGFLCTMMGGLISNSFRLFHGSIGLSEISLYLRSFRRMRFSIWSEAVANLKGTDVVYGALPFLMIIG